MNWDEIQDENEIVALIEIWFWNCLEVLEILMIWSFDMDLTTKFEYRAFTDLVILGVRLLLYRRSVLYNESVLFPFVSRQRLRNNNGHFRV